MVLVITTITMATIRNVDNISCWRSKPSTMIPIEKYTKYIPTTPKATRKPRTSYGILLCGIVEGNIKYALVKKRISYGVSFILSGNWKTEYFTELSHEEKETFVKICELHEHWEGMFLQLWQEWKGKEFIYKDYVACKEKFINNRKWILKELLSSTLIYPNGVWEFPKGRMDKKDSSSQECALRELSEETGIDIRYVHRH
jgi:hypothetical protein